MSVKTRITIWSKNRMEKLYGKPQDEVSIAFRCFNCQTPVTWAKIGTSGLCQKCGSFRFKKSNFSLWEEIKLLFLPFLYR